MSRHRALRHTLPAVAHPRGSRKPPETRGSRPALRPWAHASVGVLTFRKARDTLPEQLPPIRRPCDAQHLVAFQSRLPLSTITWASAAGRLLRTRCALEWVHGLFMPRCGHRLLRISRMERPGLPPRRLLDVFGAGEWVGRSRTHLTARRQLRPAPVTAGVKFTGGLKAGAKTANPQPILRRFDRWGVP
jgi:hypothetical protein